MKNKYSGTEIAVIGMACRFPGANDINTFWRNLKNGKESVSFLNDHDILAEGEDLEKLKNPLYVKANPYMKGKEYFDSSFFGFQEDEAKLMDPQIRIFLETCWSVIEDAGYDVVSNKEKIGLFAGGSPNLDWVSHAIKSNQENKLHNASLYSLANINFICSWVSNLLNFQGPSIYIDTACSTSLVAVQRACMSLLLRECKMAIAGGVTIRNFSNKGYLYQDGLIFSKDGHCKAFDADSSGTIFGDGAGTVMLKKLDDALKDGDNIYAIIKGSGINNDGSMKMSFTAPSVEGQYKVVLKAINMANVDPKSISYVETHGTGTSLGDPIEIEALNLAFGKEREKHCAIGSVKTNVGHLDAAAGIAGFIKTVLSINNRQIPPSLHFTKPNPTINFQEGPFYVNTELKEWKNGQTPIRAGVSSLGVGGTNVHVVLEEAPEREISSESRDFQLLLFSAKTATALDKNIQNITSKIKETPRLKLEDMAYTLQTGRARFSHRKMVVCRDKADAIDLLGEITRRKAKTVKERQKQVVFMFPGLGSQYQNMCADLYKQETVFRTAVDECLKIFKETTQVDLSAILFPASQQAETAINELDQIQYAHPALFTVEYALAQQLMDWGIKADVMIGHSIGEYVAACLSGVFSLADALKLVITRSRLIQKCPSGSMLGISISEEELLPFLKDHKDISLAAINSSELSLVSGKDEAIQAFQKLITEKGYANQWVKATHASHSYMMDEVMEEFEQEVRKVKISEPHSPFISNITGKLASYETISDPLYWVKHLRETVRFSEGISSLLSHEDTVCIEVGPGNVLGTFVRSNQAIKKTHRVIYTVRHEHKKDNDQRHLLEALGKLYLLGIEPDWNSFYKEETRQKVSLPAYAFDKLEYPVNVGLADWTGLGTTVKNQEAQEFMNIPSWEISERVSEGSVEEDQTVILFTEKSKLTKQLIEKFSQKGNAPIVVSTGQKFQKKDSSNFSINPTTEEDFLSFFKAIETKGKIKIIFAWGLTLKVKKAKGLDATKAQLDTYFYSLLNISKALTENISADIQILSISNEANYVLKGDRISPEKATLLAALKVIEQEYDNIACRNIDLQISKEDNPELVEELFQELNSLEQDSFVAFRDKTRFVESYRPVKASQKERKTPMFIAGETYLITGGSGGMGVSFTKRITQEQKGVNFILLGRRELPSNSEWPDWLNNPNNATHENFETIKSLSEIEKEGANIHYRSVDIADKALLKKTLGEVEKKAGKIRGVIHAAGVIDYAGIIYSRSKEENEKVFASKIYGTLILNEILRKNELDFFVLCSSISSILPSEGQVGYAAANRFLNSFARYNSTVNQINTTSIAYNAWREVGFAAKLAKEGGMDEKFELNSLSADEGFEILQRAIQYPFSELIISKFDIAGLIQHVQADKIKAKGGDTDEQVEWDGISYTDTSSIENAMLKLWQDFLGNTEIDLYDDFFDIGGNSLKALTLIGRIHKAFHVEISIKNFFNHSSPKSLSEYVFTHRNEEGPEKVIMQIPASEPAEYYELSSGQKRLFFIFGFDEKSLAYNIPFVYQLHGPVDKERIQHAFEGLINRHESLRTSIIMVDTVPYQKISEPTNFEIEYIKSEADKVQGVLDRFIRPFDLNQSPLFRVGLIEIGPEEHIMVIDMHHIVADGVSEGILLKDFMGSYNHEILPDMKLQYKDYAAWQQGDEWKEKIESQKEFWLNEFEEDVQVLDLPTDYPRPPVLNFEGNSINFELTEKETEKFKSVVESERVTPFILLLSIFNVLLGKLGNQEDIIIGTPVANRPHPDLEEMIGMFVNTLALRNYPKGARSFKDFLTEVRGNTLACYDNQSYPYEDLIEELKIERDTSRNALFNVAIVMYNTDNVEFSIPGLRLNSYPLEQNSSKFDITLAASESENKISLKFEYCTKLFKQETIEKFIAYFKRIVSAITEDVNIKIADIDILAHKERELLLHGFNNTKANHPCNKTIIDLFQERTLENPDKIAVTYKGESLSYKALDELSDRFGTYLIEEKGVKRGDLVAIMLDREINLIPALFGIFKSGACYVPIDSNYPVDRMNTILNDSQAKLLITRSIHLKSGLNLSQGILDLDKDMTKIVSTPVKKSRISTKPDDLAYVIYTSGSTGTPKGVMIEHCSVLNRILWIQREYPINQQDVILQKTTTVFDVSVLELFWWAVSGASLYLLPAGQEKDPHEIVSAIEKSKTTTVYFAPSNLSSFLSLLDKKFDFDRISSLNNFFVGGEAMTTKHVQSFGQTLHKHCGSNLINVYGPTEATIYSSYYDCDFTKQETSIPIGKPLDNTNLYVLDKSLRLNPLGVPGQLAIAGLGLARGYLKNEELTESKFVENPNVKGERIYLTGDWVKMRPDGNIEFLGRIDNQVKIRGYRIELGEIEHQLVKHPAVEETIVLARELKGDKKLIAYYTVSEEVTQEDLREYLGGKLPDYMVPHHFVGLDKFPLTVNGKLDRKNLPEPEFSSETTYVAPQTEEEKMLVEVWTKVLGVEQIGVMDNFFSLGGDSIKSIQVCSRVSSAGFKLSVQDIFTHRTINKLSSRLKPIVENAEQELAEKRAPLTAIQEWFFQGSVRHKNHYNQAVLLQFPDGISASEVQAIFGKLQEHHDALRTVFQKEDEQLIQEVQGLDFPLSLKEVKIEGENSAEQLMEHAQEIQSSMDVHTGPLMKLGLFHMHDGSRVMIAIHHLIIDGVSWRILFEDFELLYQQLKKENPFSLPAKTSAYQTWSQQLRTYTETSSFSRAMDYWENIDFVAAKRLEADKPEGDKLNKQSRIAKFQLDKNYSDKLLREVHASFNTQINDLLLAGLLLSIYKKYGHDQVLIELEGHGREELQEGIDVSRTVGWFTSMYPVLLSGKSDRLSQLIKQVKESLRRVPNKGMDYLFHKYFSELKSNTTQQPTASPQIVFNYFGQIDADLGDRSFLIADEVPGDIMSQDELLAYEWDITGIIQEGQLSMSLKYSTDRYESETIDEVMQLYKESLQEIISYCANYGKTELTPADLTFKGLSIPQLDELQNAYEIDDIYPLSPMQGGMLYHTLSDTESDHYFEQIILELKGKLEIEGLEKSLVDLIARYPVLRTTILENKYGRPLQLALKEGKVDFSFIDISEACYANPGKEIQKSYHYKDRSRKFDLNQDALIRLTLLKIGEDSFEMIWSFHHILMDGWCVGIIFNDFRALYKKHVEGLTLSLPEVEPYANYIDWLEKKDKEYARQYWQDYLADYSNQASLPIKENSSFDPTSFERSDYELILDKEQTKSLTQIAQKQGVTLNTFLQSAWGLLLSKYNDTNDVVFGAVVSGRPAEVEGIETMVGLFINTIPIRVQMNKEDRFDELLQRVQFSALESEPHHYHPLSEIQADTELGRDLLNHIIVFENYPVSEEIEKSEHAKVEDFKVEGVQAFEQTNYDLSIETRPGAEMEIRFQYNAAVYDTAMIKRTADHLNRIINQVISNPRIQLSQLNMLSESELDTITRSFNQTAAPYPIDKTVLDLFEEQVAKTPQKVAITYEGQELTYEELNIRSNQLGSYLQTRGVKSESLIGLCMEKSLDVMVGMFGIMKAGGTYVPIDPSYPTQRISYIIEDTDMEIIVGNAEVMEVLNFIEEDGPDIVQIDVEWETISQHPTDTPIRELGPENLIYIIYTSGSTGKPKGVLIEHRSVTNLITGLSQKFGFSPDDQVLQISSISFDASVEQIYLALSNGASIVLVSKSTLIDKKELGRVMREHKVSHLHATPSYLINLMKTLDPADLGSLKRLVSGGEPCSTAFAEEWKGRLNFFNEYGPTETTITNTIYPYTPQEKASQSILPIGKPIQNNYFYILDEFMQPVPIGIPGEIYIGGVTLCRGYLNRVQLNREKFIDNPFDKGLSLKLYKSGDKAKWLPDGKIEILGRIDDQVKVRGFRVEPGEIENQLSKYHKVKQSIVLAKGKPGEKYLIAYYTAEQELSPAELKEHLLEELPSYMIPGFYIYLKSLPLTSNGKVDKKSLPDIEISAGEDYKAPANEIEEKLSVIWSEVLGVGKEKISTSTNFFEIGGESLKALTMIGKIQQVLDVNIGIKDFFKNSSIEKLGELISTLNSDTTQRAPRKKLEKAAEKEFYPASPTQERMYFQHLLHKESASFNISIPLELRGNLDADRLEKSFQQLLDRHENLRTSFFLSDNGVTQKINEGYFFQLERMDANKYPDLETAFQSFTRSFDLSQESLFRAALLSEVSGQNFLFVEVHHIVADKISFDVLFRDFKKIYFGEEISPLKFRYVDYASWIKSDLKELEAQKSFWLEKLSGDLPQIDLPIIQEREAIDILKVASQELVLEQELYQAIRELSATEDVSDFMLFLSVYYLFLSKIVDSEDIIIGTEVLGRTHPELKDIVGNFINVLPLRMQIDNELSYIDFLKQVKDGVLEALENQDFQFDKMVSLLSEGVELNRNPLFDTHFSVSTAGVEDPENEEALSFKRISLSDTLRGDYEFSINLREDAGTYILSFIYREELYDAETIESLIGYYYNILKDVLRNRQKEIQQIELESLAEQAY